MEGPERRLMRPGFDLGRVELKLWGFHCAPSVGPHEVSEPFWMSGPNHDLSAHP